VESAQVCAVHHHHAYWRFDFDITGSANDLVREFVPLQFPASLLYLTPFKKWIRKLEWKTRFLVETKRFRSEQTKWRILDGTGKGYELIPGHHDTPAQSMPDWSNDTDYPEFPGADLWVLRNHEDEPDDHVVAPGPPEQVDLDQFLDGESVYMQDIVVWYGGHVSHDFDADAPGTFGHIVGPTLRPIGSWN
jgi:Cu2+-containing amine oxidase